MEHRCGARYDVDLAACVRTHSGVVSSLGWLRNVSLSGGFLLTPLSVRLLGGISLQLIDSRGRFGPRLEGHVVRRIPQGLGIEWSEYAPELIRNLIQEGCVAQGERLSHEQLLGLPDLIAFRYRVLRTMLRGRARVGLGRSSGPGEVFPLSVCRSSLE